MQFKKNWMDAYYRGVEYNDADYETPEMRFQTWLLDLLAFLGGGIGMFVSFVINRERPVAYNGTWWSFCYTSILFWFTIYCYLCNPFGFKINGVQLLSSRHIPLLIYIFIINALTALFIFLIRKKKFGETDFKHTIIFLLGALGGTVSAILTVFLINREGKYYYVTTGFSIMLISQIVFVMYMIAVGIF